MATIKLYLDIRARKQDGTFPLKLSVNHHGKSALIPLNIFVKKSQWDGRGQRFIDHPAKSQLQKIVDNIQSKAVTELLDAKANGTLKGMEITEIRDYIRRRIDPDFDADEEIIYFCQWYEKVMERHTNPRTHEIYLMTLQWIQRFDDRFERLRFEDITKDWLQRFFLFMAASSPSINARNIHLRNIRSVINDAIDNDITTAYPFRKFKIKPAPTAKRNLKVEQLRTLLSMDVPAYQRKYLDAFKLSILLCGINIGDLCLLMPENVVDGRVQYIRQKTGKLYSIKIEPETADLLAKYKGRERLLSFAENCRKHPYKAFANRANKNLSEMMQCVTTYWARHSWATIASYLDIPDDTIALALGHSARNSTTAIYIERDRRKIDAANRKVIDYLLYNQE